MKLIIQIPCYNEHATLPETIRDLPRSIPGIDVIEYLIIDDGSTDGTAALAPSLGVHHVVRFAQNRGLARGFVAGIDACLRLGADIIVNTDADNQYEGGDIAALVRPIVDGQADMVIGDRQVETVAHFSTTKKRLQKIGSWVVRQASSTRIADTTSGFRAMNREAALRTFVASEFSYTLETVIQAGNARLALTSVPIRTNPKTRESRLFRSIPQYLNRSAGTILRIYTMYRPLKAFLYMSLFLFLTGSVLGMRFLYFHLTEPQAGRVQSLIFAAICLIVAFLVLMSGILADLIGANRKLMEDALVRLRRIEYGTPSPSSKSTLPPPLPSPPPHE